MGVIGAGAPTGAATAASVASTRSGVNMVVVGDSGVGKTSLITTLVSSIFPETVPAVLQQVHVPPEDTADNIALSISDTSSDPDHRNKVLDQVRRAHVVIVVYSEEHGDSFLRVRSYWLKAITQVFSGPIIVVGNKVDLLPRDTNADRTEELQRKTTPLVKEFKHQVDVCLQCSAKLNMNVNEVFYFAQHAVVYPVAPLLDTQSHTLTPAFRTALSRVFRVFDVDRDGLLSNVELNNFQEQCFGARLQPADIQGVKKVLQKEAFDYVAEGGISLPGFLLLNQLFIQRNRVETPWLILRRFGYDDKLQLHVRSDELKLTTRVALDQSVELSKRALSFLAAIFHQFDADKDGTLSPAELEQLFEICPEPASPWDPRRSLACLNSRDNANDGTGPIDQRLSAELSANPLLAPQSLSWLGDFPRGVHTNAAGHVSLDGWLAQWSMTALIQPFTAALYLRYLGFQGDIANALTPTRRRRIENRNNSLQRTVVRGFVFGAAGVGKSALLDALVRQTTGSRHHSSLATEATTTADSQDVVSSSPAGMPRSASAMVHSRTERSGTNSNSNDNSVGQDRGSYLVLTEVPDTEVGRREALNGMHDCDLAVLVLDASDPKSVASLRNVQQQIPESVPCVYLANKMDLVEPTAATAAAATVESRDGGSKFDDDDSVHVGDEDVEDANISTNPSEMATDDVAAAASAAVAEGFPRKNGDDGGDGQGEGVVQKDDGGISGAASVSAASAQRVGGSGESSSSAEGGGVRAERRAPSAMDEAIKLCTLYNLADPEPVMLSGDGESGSSSMNVDENQRVRKLERLFELLLTIALRPDAARPISDERRTSLRRARVLRATLRITAVAASFALSGYLLWKLGVGVRGDSSNSSESANSNSSTGRGASARISRTPTMMIRQRQAGLSSSLSSPL